MKKMNKFDEKKWIAMLCALILCLGVLAGCTEKSSTTDNDGKQTGNSLTETGDLPGETGGSSGEANRSDEEKTLSLSVIPQTISKGRSGYLAILEDGTLAGSSKKLENVVCVSQGDGFSAAITEDGSLYTWGENNYGQLGNGTTEKSSEPVKIMDHAVYVSLGYRHSAAITEDGSLYTWGYNGFYQLGDGGKENSSVPIKIFDNVIYVSLGENHSAAITADGSLYTWGYNGQGQLGFHESVVYVFSPQKVDMPGRVTSISLGGDHSAAITEDRSLYTWGRNSSGQLGDGTTDRSFTPIKIMDNVEKVSLGESHSAAIRTYDGVAKLFIWGSDLHYQLGFSDGKDQNRPCYLIDNYVDVALGNTTIGLSADGTLYSWGGSGQKMAEMVKETDGVRLPE